MTYRKYNKKNAHCRRYHRVTDDLANGADQDCSPNSFKDGTEEDDTIVLVRSCSATN